MIQAQTLEQAQAIVNSSPHARGGMLADSGAGRGVASAYWALTFLRVGLCSRPHSRAMAMGKQLTPTNHVLTLLHITRTVLLYG